MPATLLDTYFPKTVKTKQQSLILMKKLLYVSVSTIAYLRLNFDENDFSTIKLDGRKEMSLLKKKPVSQKSHMLSKYMERALNFLEEASLKEFILIVCLDPGNPDIAFETFKFTFDYSEMSLNGNTFKIDTCTDDSFNRDVQAFIRRFLIGTNNMGLIPQKAFVTAKYVVDKRMPFAVLPDDLLQRSTQSKIQFSAEPTIFQIGQVKTRFHIAKAEITSLAHYNNAEPNTESAQNMAREETELPVVRSPKRPKQELNLSKEASDQVPVMFEHILKPRI